MNREEFTRRLVEARIDAGLTQEELSKQLGARGQAYINNWEGGAYPGTFEKLYEFAVACGVSIDYLFGLSSSKIAITKDALDENAAHLLKQYLELSAVGQEDLADEMQRIAEIDAERRKDMARQEVYAVLSDSLLNNEESVLLRDAILAARAGDLATAHALARRIRRRLGLDSKDDLVD